MNHDNHHQGLLLAITLLGTCRPADVDGLEPAAEGTGGPVTPPGDAHEASAVTTDAAVDSTGAPSPPGDESTDEGGDDDLSPAELEAQEDELPRPASVDDTVSAMGHFHVARQASTYFAGPQSEALAVDVRDFELDTGIAVGTSPWHVLSTPRYRDPAARTVWGASLTHVYKAVIDGSTFEVLEPFRLNGAATSIPWNLLAYDDGRVIVPDQDGFRATSPEDPCYGTLPALLVLRDNADGAGDPRSAVRCEKKFELDPAELRDVCGAPDGAFMVRRLSGINTLPVFGGGLATIVVFERQAARQYYLAVIDDPLDALVACAWVDDSAVTNEFPGERRGPSTTAMYVPTGDAIVKMEFDASRGELTRRWERTVPMRDRTGTTPTLVDAEGGSEAFVVLVDGQCATSNVRNGLITCSEDTSPSRLVAVRRDDDVDLDEAVLVTTLPPQIQTVENSPAVRGGAVVIANYSGYLPNGLRVPAGGVPPAPGLATWGVSPDAIPEFAAGMVALKYRSESGEFEVDWVVDEQISGVPTISGGANLVYGTGAEPETGMLYLYAFLLDDDPRGPAGTRIIRQPLGAAPFREPAQDEQGNVVFPVDAYSLGEGELFDAGNNLLIDRDRSLLMTGGRSLVRIREG